MNNPGTGTAFSGGASSRMSKNIGGQDYSFSSERPPHSDTMQEQTNSDRLSAETTRAAQEDELQRKLQEQERMRQSNDPFGRPWALPLAARASVGRTDPTLYKNRPYITIVAFDGSKDINMYDNFILTDIQEQDAEKVDAIETFGAPHLFASGRFMRRYTFQGIVRTTPVCWNSKEEILHVPMSTMFRRFYTDYMRASVQAQKRWYTRIVVDMEVYEGFITTFNMQRSSNIDTTETFVFSMLAFNQHHLQFDDDTDKVLASEQGFKITAGIKSRRGIGEIEKEVQDASQQGEFKVSPSTFNAGVVSYRNQTSDTGARQIVRLSAALKSEQLFVECNVPGVELIFRASIQGGRKSAAVRVHGSYAPTGGSSELDYRITDYWALYDALRTTRHSGEASPATSPNVGRSPNAGDAASAVAGVIPLTIFTRSGKKASLTLRIVLEPPSSVELIKAKGLVGGRSLSVDEVTVLQDVNTKLFLGEIDNASAYDDYGRLHLDVQYYIGTPDGLPVPPPAILNSTIEYKVKRIYPALGSSLMEVSDSHDLALCTSADIELGVPIPVPSDVAIRHPLTVIPAVKDAVLKLSNPFNEADRFVVELQPVIKMAGYPEISKTPTLQIAVKQGTSKMQSALKALTFIGAVWQPVLSAPSKLTGSATQLDRFGYLKFLLLTDDNRNLSPLLMTALKAGSLSYKTKYLHDGTGNLRLGRIPLSGASYGSGEVLDAVSQKAVQLRMTASSLVWQQTPPGLLITVELNVTHQSGEAANLYSDRYWDYISTVEAAEISIPESTGVKSPSAWGL